MSVGQLFPTYAKEIIAAVGTIAAWLLNTYLKPRARLIQGVRHASNILINEPTFDKDGKHISPTKLVAIAQVSFINTGREPATDVQITFNWRPQHFSVWPSRHYSEHIAPDQRFTLNVGTLPPKEFIAIDLLSVVADLPMITSAHCNECSAKIIPLSPQVVHPKWKLFIVLYLMIAGFFGSIYAAVALIQATVVR